MRTSTPAQPAFPATHRRRRRATRASASVARARLHDHLAKIGARDDLLPAAHAGRQGEHHITRDRAVSRRLHLKREKERRGEPSPPGASVPLECAEDERRGEGSRDARRGDEERRPRPRSLEPPQLHARLRGTHTHRVRRARHWARIHNRARLHRRAHGGRARAPGAPEVWLALRAAYVSGLCGRQVCVRT
eukprot:4875387-Prymnesium_polylepis.1